LGTETETAAVVRLGRFAARLIAARNPPITKKLKPGMNRKAEKADVCGARVFNVIAINRFSI
jgi:hypothetical protein